MAGLKNGGDFDAVVIGAGFSGMGMLRRLRDEMGMSVQVYEAGSGVGGTWYWNRYPGARCDSESYTYCFTFSKELLQEWSWSGRYPEQPEILTYLNHVADRFDFRRNIQFKTKVTSATFLEDRNLWEIETDQGDRVTARHLITGIGCISTGNIPKIKGTGLLRRGLVSHWQLASPPRGLLREASCGHRYGVERRAVDTRDR